MHAPRPRREGGRDVHVGFIPLLDCAPLVIARERGFDARFGVSLHLHREVSWANIRDKLDVGAFDCAHMLAPMPIAATLGLARAAEPVIAPMSLSLNGNAITVSQALFAEMGEADGAATAAVGMASARALAEVVRRRAEVGRAPLTLGMVYPFSCHNYDLRFWLASAGVDPDNDVNIVVIPPPLLAESLKAGRVDGFCVGQPWNSVAVGQGHGVVIATKSELWPLSPEKVLGVREDWAARNGELLADVLRALTMAGQWLDEPENRVEAAAILARRDYLDIPEERLAMPLTGTMARGGGLPDITDPDLVVFHRHAANFPWRSHAVWLITQMIRWGQARQPFDILELAARVYRPDLYRAAVGELGLALPDGDYKPEEGDGLPFFADAGFDARAVMRYLERLPIRSAAADLDAFAACNG
jgi:two-component system, oxyanion-binding sensor